MHQLFIHSVCVFLMLHCLDPPVKMPCGVHPCPCVASKHSEEVNASISATLPDGPLDSIEMALPVSVQGRIKERASFWLEQLEVSKFVAGIVTEGYRLPFYATPDPIFQFNHPSAVHNALFVERAIAELLRDRCVVEVKDCPAVCSPLQVVSNSKGKLRLVLDLRHVNQFLWKEKFKYEGLELVPQLFKRGEYFFTFDLKSGYHHVDINSEFWTYLGFSWSSGSSRRWYTFRVLPFGLATACYVFTKLLRPLVKRWRAAGLRAIVYIDDGICVAPSFIECIVARDLIVGDLQHAGLLLNLRKSQLDPVQLGEWLGFIIDLIEGSFAVPSCKIVKLCNAIRSIPQLGGCPVRAVASVVGQIIAMGRAIGPVARLRTRALYQVIEERWSWSGLVMLSEEARQELQFWNQNMHSLNGQPIWFSTGATRVVFSDASATGYGGYVIELGREVAHGQWSLVESKQSSTWRELKAVDQVLRSFAVKLAGHRVKWFTDNQNVVRIVQSGSRRQHLQDGAMSIFEVCLAHNIRLDVAWIPRTLNDRADFLSRIVDYDDWQLCPVVFCQLDAMWGPHTIDRFASFYNTQLERFDSRCWDPHCEAVDTFTRSWSGEVNWWVPPQSLVCRTLLHAESCGARGTLVVPAWKSAPHWPLISPDGCHLAPFVQCWCAIVYYDGLLLPGRSGSNIASAMQPGSSILCLHVDFSVGPRTVKTGFCVSDVCV